MGLHLNYELGLPSTVSEHEAADLVRRLREHALELPFDHVTDLRRLTELELVERPPLLAPLAFRIDDIAHFNGVSAREELYARVMEIPENEIYERKGIDIIYHPVDIPRDMISVAYAFSIAVGRGSEPASLGVLQIRPHGKQPSQWWWQCFCKTQYASVHGDENLLRCHRSLVAVLDAADKLGFQVSVRDETGYWESRDADQLLGAVTHMNQLIAGFAGTVTDAVRDMGVDSRGITAEIFKHPDFERLEMAKPNEPD